MWYGNERGPVPGFLRLSGRNGFATFVGGDGVVSFHLGDPEARSCSARVSLPAHFQRTTTRQPEIPETSSASSHPRNAIPSTSNAIVSSRAWTDEIIHPPQGFPGTNEVGTYEAQIYRNLVLLEPPCRFEPPVQLFQL